MTNLTARLAALSPEKRKLLERRLHKDPSNVSIRIQPREGATRPPLSFAQQRLWFLEQLEPGHSFYNLPFTTRLSGSISVTALERALNEIVRRHEALRTTFELENGEPIQIIAPELRISLQCVDLRSAPTHEREMEASRRAMEEAMQPFDLQRGPLIRAKLLGISETNHLLIVTMHHIVSDGWSLEVLARELNLLYSAYCSGKDSPLSKLPAQYADFSIWQRNHLRGETLEKLLSYWNRKLRGMARLLEIPTDRPRPRVQNFTGASYLFPIEKKHSEALKIVARQQDATLFMTLLAAFKTLLYRFSGVTDMVVGTPIANRNRVELEDLIGFFVNTLVLRTDLGGNPSFREIVGRVKEVALEAFAHQDLPFEKLVEELQPERNLSHNPLFQVMFGLQNTNSQQAERNGDSQLIYGTSKFDLTLNICETLEGLSCVFEFNSELFNPDTIASFAKAFGVILAGAAAFPDIPISRLPLVSEVDRQDLLTKAASQGSQPEALLVHELFERRVALNPKTIAVECGDQKLTWENLDMRANQLARALRQQGVGRDVLVGLFIDRSIELLVAMFAIWKAGSAFVPLDLSYPKERIAYMIKDTGTRNIVTRSALVKELPPFDGAVWALDTDWSWIGKLSAEPLGSLASSEDLAYVIYTSGSTGHPKGVMALHRGTCFAAQAQVDMFRLGHECRILQFGSLSFDTAIYDVLMAVGCGGTLCLAQQDSIAPGNQLIETLRRKRINVITIPPSALAAVPFAELPDLSTIVAGGEAPTAELVARWQSGRRFYNAYGPTETTIWAAAFHCLNSDTAPPIGRAISNVRVYVLGAWLEPLPRGFPGEIYIGGPGVTRGYLNRPDLTAERYIPDPFSSIPGARLYATGDRARLLPTGDIQFLGRADDQIKLRGYRIELGEIETILRRHPHVHEAAVVTQRSPSGEVRIAAYCVAVKGERLDRTEVTAYLRRHLPEFMVPALISVQDALPLNNNGKLDRTALSVWTNSGLESQGGWVAPRSETESTLSSVFSEVLEVEHVGSNDSFFELGGHSLLATRAITRINNAFGIVLSLRQLFESPTIAELAAVVEQIRAAGPRTDGPAMTRVVRRAVTAPMPDRSVS